MQYTHTKLSSITDQDHTSDNANDLKKAFDTVDTISHTQFTISEHVKVTINHHRGALVCNDHS